MAMTSIGATYTAANGAKATPYSENGATGTVAAGTIFDPNSSNYNAKIANSNGTLNLGNVNNSGSSALQSVVQGATTPSYSYTTPSVTNNSSLISSQYDQALAASQAALKASIQQSMGTYQDTIAKAPTTYQPLRDQASAAGASNSQNLQEMLANNGQQGGVNRTESTAVNSATENNINTLNTQQQGVIDTANKAISDLQAQGDIKGAELVAQNASDKLSALIAESNRVSAANTAAAQTAFQNGISVAGLTGTYNGASTLAGQSLANTISQQNTDNTGYTANGTQTIAGKTADANIADTTASTALKSAQLKEITDPNSTTNQLAKLGLQTAQLNYAALPAQLKGQADKTAQDLATGKITQQTAQVQLNALPAQLAAQTNATNASAAASKASAAASYASASRTTSSGSASTAKAPTAAQTKASTDSNINAATAYVTKMVYTNNNTTAKALSTLTSNKGTILEGLQNAGMSGANALAYYTQIYNDLTGK